MFKTAFVVTVLLALALQCTDGNPVAEIESAPVANTINVSNTPVVPNAASADNSTIASSSNTTTTVAPSRSNGISSKGNCVLFVQVSAAIAFAAKHVMSL